MKKTETYKMILAAMFVAIGVLLPMAFHSMGMMGSVFSPMHIPVLLCGMICGWKYGGITGALVPFLSSFLTGMPPLYPTALAMAFELVTYGIIAGLLVKKFPIIVSLLIAMLAGRAVLGIANTILLGIAGQSYGFSVFLTSAFVTALPGIVIQVILIPAIMLILNRTKVLNRIR